MGDAVHFALTTLPFPPFDGTSEHDTSKFNGFPMDYRTDADIVGREQFFPFRVDYLTLIKWYWRVKRWSLAITGSTTSGSVTKTFTSGELVPTAIGGYNSPSRELDLLGVTATTAWTGFHGITADSEIYIFPNTDNISGMFNPWIWQEVVDDIVYYRPSIRLAGTISADDASDDDPPYDPDTDPPEDAPADPTSLNYDTVAIDGYTDTLTGQIDGIDFPIYVKADAPGTGSVSSVILTPLEYWPYAAADGSPIYDTATGDQIQDPRN